MKVGTFHQPPHFHRTFLEGCQKFPQLGPAIKISRLTGTWSGYPNVEIAFTWGVQWRGREFLKMGVRQPPAAPLLKCLQRCQKSVQPDMKLRLAPLQGTTRGFPAPTRQCHLCHLRAHSVQVTFAVLPKFTQMRHEAGTYRWWRYPMGEHMGKISRGWCVKCGQREFLKRCVLKLHLEAMLRRCPKWPAKFPVGTHDHVGSVT